MSVSWEDFFLLPEDRLLDGLAASKGSSEERKIGRRKLFGRLRESLAKTRGALGAEIKSTLFETIDDEALERLEELLIGADLGVKTTALVVERLEHAIEAKEIKGGEDLAKRLAELLAEYADIGNRTIDLRSQPAVLLVTGVNGTGKTTSIGKLAWQLHKQLGLHVLLVAADTFRAAAVEQLALWAERTDCELIERGSGVDPSSVAYEGLAKAKEVGADVVIIDTAGRLHVHDHLMAELAKVRKVIAKQLPGAPHETLMVVDATTGQNGLRQAQRFAEEIDISGIVLTKLDGTAKGGIAVAIAQELGIPVKLIGVGEGMEDLRPFDPRQFADAVMGVTNE